MTEWEDLTTNPPNCPRCDTASPAEWDPVLRLWFCPCCSAIFRLATA